MDKFLREEKKKDIIETIVLSTFAIAMWGTIVYFIISAI